MSLNLNKIKRGKMRISLKILSFLIVLSALLHANEEENIDKLDLLEKQSKEFFNSVVGLEKDYLEEQISKIENNSKNRNKVNSSSFGNINNSNRKELSQEEKEKNIFKHQNEIAKLTTDFTRTKKLKDISIKSMYSFNGKDYVVLKLDRAVSNSPDDELSSNIEGRYRKGDYILGHLINAVNLRTKSIKLYKKLDNKYGYYIYLSNYGISVSDLIKVKKEFKNEKDTENLNLHQESKVKDAFAKMDNKSVKIPMADNSCLYKVLVSSLNVRNRRDINAKILRVLKKGDKFSISKKTLDWVKIDTIYKKVSKDIMPVKNESNWVNITLENVSKDSCK